MHLAGLEKALGRKGEKHCKPVPKGGKEAAMKVAIVINRTRDGYRAWCPALPGCVEFGRNREEAGERIAQAVRGYLASMDSQQPVTLISAETEEVYT